MVRLDPDLQPELERIINKALEKTVPYDTRSHRIRTDLQRLKRELSLPESAPQASPDQPPKRCKLGRPSRLYRRHRTGCGWDLVPAVRQASRD